MLGTPLPKYETAELIPPAKTDTAAVLAKMGRDAPEPIVVDTRAYGPWFHMMANKACQTDQQLGNRDIGSLNLEAALGLPGAESLDLEAYVQRLNNWAYLVRAYTEAHWYQYLRSPEVYDNSPARFRMLCSSRSCKSTSAFTTTSRSVRATTTPPIPRTCSFMAYCRGTVGRARPCPSCT